MSGHSTPALTDNICAMSHSQRRELRDIRSSVIFPSNCRLYRAYVICQGQATKVVAVFLPILVMMAPENLGISVAASPPGQNITMIKGELPVVYPSVITEIFSVMGIIYLSEKVVYLSKKGVLFGARRAIYLE